MIPDDVSLTCFQTDVRETNGRVLEGQTLINENSPKDAGHNFESSHRSKVKI
ncbi:unnamed protein product, partial [Nesidiocoris tenuis]